MATVEYEQVVKYGDSLGKSVKIEVAKSEKGGIDEVIDKIRISGKKESEKGSLHLEIELPNGFFFPNDGYDPVMTDEEVTDHIEFCETENKSVPEAYKYLDNKLVQPYSQDKETEETWVSSDKSSPWQDDGFKELEDML